MNEIKKLSDLDHNQVNQAINVFVEGFYNIFSSITKDKEKLHKIFKHSFDYSMTYAYLQNGEAIGFMGIRVCEKHPIKLNKEVFIKSIDGLGGKFAYKITNAALEKVTPAKLNETYIDYLTTAPGHRGKGIGTKLIEYACDYSKSDYLMLEVFSKNTDAKKLYERLGFEVIKVRTNVMMLLQGFGRPITMRMSNKQRDLAEAITK